jgi:transposase
VVSQGRQAHLAAASGAGRHALERLLFPDEGRPRASRPEPDWTRIHLELRKKHVTKALLWEEYKSVQPDGLQYSQFCEKYAVLGQYRIAGRCA